MWMIIVAVIYFFFMMYLRGRMVNKGKKEKKWREQICNRYQPICIIQCKKGVTLERPHKRFEYVGQTVEEGVIIGIYVDYKPTKKEAKYERLCRKWR